MRARRRRLILGIVAGIVVGTMHALVTHAGDVSGGGGLERSGLFAVVEADDRVYVVVPLAGQGGAGDRIDHEPAGAR